MVSYEVGKALSDKLDKQPIDFDNKLEIKTRNMEARVFPFGEPKPEIIYKVVKEAYIKGDWIEMKSQHNISEFINNITSDKTEGA